MCIFFIIYNTDGCINLITGVLVIYFPKYFILIYHPRKIIGLEVKHYVKIYIFDRYVKLVK